MNIAKTIEDLREVVKHLNKRHHTLDMQYVTLLNGEDHSTPQKQTPELKRKLKALEKEMKPLAKQLTAIEIIAESSTSIHACRAVRRPD